MITIISAGTPDYQDMMAENRRRCEALGYRYVSHPLELSFDLQGALPPCTFKPELMAKVLSAGEPRTVDEQRVTGDDPADIIAWMDADAIVVRPLDDLAEIEFDVAVTLREPELIGTTQPTSNYLNAGVIFFRNTEQSRRFVDDWREMTARTENDQAALNKLIGPGWSDGQWRTSYGACVLHKPTGAWIYILPCAEFNHSDWNRPPIADARILHFKHGWRDLRGPGWWRSALAAHA